MTMVYDYLVYLFNGMLCVAMDFILFVLVDGVAKSPLREASTVDEKRTIWLLEAGALLFLSIGVYIVHHVPYLLMFLTSVTLLYTQVHGRVDFSYWWTQLATKWDEFQQHEESMEEHRERTRLYGNQPYPTISIPYVPNVTTQTGRPGQFTYQRGSILPKFDRQPTTVTPRSDQMPPPNVNVTPSGFEKPVLVSTGPSVYSKTPQQNSVIHRNAFSQQSVSKPVPNHYRTKVHKGPVFKQLTDTASIVKSRVMSVMGYNSTTLPPGIWNAGNTCFAISSLQCLARSKHFVENLVGSLTELSCSDLKLSILSSASTELLYNLNMAPGTCGQRVLQLQDFCDSAANAGCSLFFNSPGTQQDAAEFLMWLLENLSDAFKTEKKGVKRKFNSSSLEVLRFIYGDLDAERIKELKNACRREIDQAHGLQNITYAEPIQRLSDLEWLTYKHENSSVVDDQFTGQIVESRHCVECNRVSVSIQTFNVLPVPILSVVDKDGHVSLDDCLTKFGVIEKLYGTEGLRCPNCSLTPFQATVSSTPMVGQRSAERARANSTPMPGVHASELSPSGPSLLMSPIQHSDSPREGGLNDSTFRMSTPIDYDPSGGDKLVNGKHRLTDGQRRSLLRHLPPCIVIQLLRFRLNPFNGLPLKVHTPVDFPLQGLDLRTLVYDTVTNREDLTAVDSSFVYDLYGMCLHLGAESTSSGHYIAYCKAVDGKWYRFDDDRVELVDIAVEMQSSLVQENAYMLFYGQCTASP